MGTYSFISIQATIAGPGGVFSLGYGSGNAKEGISFAMNEDKNTMMIGADGTPMHSLHAGRGGLVTVRLLKSAPTNQLLSNLYSFQTSNPASHGQNLFQLTDVNRGDYIAASEAAFKKFPDLTYAEDGDVIAWTFDAGYVDPSLGSGL